MLELNRKAAFSHSTYDYYLIVSLEIESVANCNVNKDQFLIIMLTSKMFCIEFPFIRSQY